MRPEAPSVVVRATQILPLPQIARTPWTGKPELGPLDRYRRLDGEPVEQPHGPRPAGQFLGPDLSTGRGTGSRHLAGLMSERVLVNGQHRFVLEQRLREGVVVRKV